MGYGCFLNWGYPQFSSIESHFTRIFHCKPSSLRNPHEYGNPPYKWTELINDGVKGNPLPTKWDYPPSSHGASRGQSSAKIWDKFGVWSEESGEVKKKGNEESREVKSERNSEVQRIRKWRVKRISISYRSEKSLSSRCHQKTSLSALALRNRPKEVRRLWLREFQYHLVI